MNNNDFKRKVNIKKTIEEATPEQIEEFIENNKKSGISEEMLKNVKLKVYEKTGIPSQMKKNFNFKLWIPAVACLCIAVAVSLCVKYLDFENNRGVITSGENLQSEITPNISEGNSKDVSVEELTSSETASMVETSTSDHASEDVNTSSENLPFYPPEGAKIVYGENTVSRDVEGEYFSGFINFSSNMFEDTNNTGLNCSSNDIENYYYVCIDVRNSNLFFLESDEELCKKLENGLHELGIKVEKIDGEAIYVAYVTKRQINALEKAINEDGFFEGIGIGLYCVAENFVDEWMEEEAKNN